MPLPLPCLDHLAYACVVFERDFELHTSYLRVNDIQAADGRSVGEMLQGEFNRLLLLLLQ